MTWKAWRIQLGEPDNVAAALRDIAEALETIYARAQEWAPDGEGPDLPIEPGDLADLADHIEDDFPSLEG